MRRIALFAGLVGSLALAGAVQAHTPYLAPTTFAPDRPFVTVQAALSETNFFVPDFPIRGQGDYWATGPSGTPTKADNVTMLKEYAAVEFSLPADGTWRLSTGERAGRQAKWARIDGAWKMVRPAGQPGGGRPPGGGEGGGPRFVEEQAVPADAETMTSVSYLRAETYVTKGAPNRGALKPTGQGVEVEPITHPNEIFVGDAFKFRLLNDGKPLPGVEFSIARAGDIYAEKKFSHVAKTAADGAGTATFTQPGAYVLEVHYPIRAEGASEPVARSNVYTLTFEVTR